MRLDIVDGIRGHLLIGMLIAHLSFAPGMSALGYFHHHVLIKMYDAEFFIPISGFIIGYLFAERLNTNKLFYGFLNTRLWTIYKYYLLSALPFILFSFAADSSFSIVSLMSNVVVMQDGGAYSDILPIYFYCFLLLYALFWMVPRVGFAMPLVISAAIYLVSQSAYQTGMFGLSSRFVIFDVAAWQFLFMIFLFVGSRSKQAGDAIISMPKSGFLGVFVGLLALFLITRQITVYATPFPGFETLNGNWPRMQLHPVFLAKILIVCTLFGMLMVRPEGLLSLPYRVAKWYFSLPFLRNVGRYSIQMFTLHVFMMAIFKQIDAGYGLVLRYTVAVGMISIFIAAPNLWLMAKQRKASQPQVAT